MSLAIGLVGLPNAGKSTLFNALIKKSRAQVASHPFTTIQPNIGNISLPDNRLKKIAQIAQTPNLIPAQLKLFDIAGLVRGAHRGNGLGSQFLAEINRVDLIILVIRFFEHSDIPHPENNLHPGNDAKTLLAELALKDLSTIEKRQQKLTKELKNQQLNPAKKKILLSQSNLLNRLSQELNQGDHFPSLLPEEKLLIQDLALLTIKPIIFVANCSEEQLPEAEEMVKNFCPDFQNYPWIILDAASEAEMIKLNQTEQTAMRQLLGLGADALEQIMRQSFKKLNLISFFTFNQQETRAWQIKRGTPAREASANIHADFYRNFIKAQIINFESFKKITDLKTINYRTEGAHYIIQDGDIVKFILRPKKNQT